MKRTKVKGLTKSKAIRHGSQDPRSIALSTLRQAEQDPEQDSLHPTTGAMTPYAQGTYAGQE